MDLNAKKEQFSIAYLRAVAAVAGFSVAQPSVDDDSIDQTLSARDRDGYIGAPKLDIQLKCTRKTFHHDDFLHFELPRKNYDDLRQESFTPRVLVVLIVPEDDTDSWLEHHEDALVLRQCAYWMSLHGLLDTNNQSKTVKIPRSQMFTVKELKTIMKKISERRFP